MTPSTANRIIFILSLAGVVVTLMLTVSHLTRVDMPCTITHGCDEVDRHYTSNGFGIPFLKAIPTAAFGLLMYVVLAALSFKRVVTESEAAQRKLANLQWLLALGGVAVSAWLTYLEAYVIHAWCQWCLATAAIVFLIFLAASGEKLAGRAAGLNPTRGETS